MAPSVVKVAAAPSADGDDDDAAAISPRSNPPSPSEEAEEDTALLRILGDLKPLYRFAGKGEIANLTREVDRVLKSGHGLDTPCASVGPPDDSHL